MIAMKIILYFIIPVCFVTCLPALTLFDSTQSLPEFRNVKWGATLNDVRKQETAHYLQSFSGFGVEALSYKGNVAGLDARIDYTFKNEKLAECSYAVTSDDNFRNDFLILLSYLENHYGKPAFDAGPTYTSGSVWIKINNYGMYMGPSFYWVFENGFIYLFSQKFKEEITLTILFVSDLTIDEYNLKNFVELKDFRIIP